MKLVFLAILTLTLLSGCSGNKEKLASYSQGCQDGINFLAERIQMPIDAEKLKSFCDGAAADALKKK